MLTSKMLYSEVMLTLLIMLNEQFIYMRNLPQNVTMNTTDNLKVHLSKLDDKPWNGKCFPEKQAFKKLHKCGDNKSPPPFVVGPKPDAEYNPLGHWPWMASIGYYDQTDEWIHQCGATLITSSHFLTAAHCVSNLTGWMIHVGDWDLNNTKSDPLGVDVDIKEVRIHPRYNGKSYFDVAVIKTNEVEFSYDIRSICLPEMSGTNRDFHKVELLGWGSSERNGKISNALNRVTQVIYPNYHCNDTFTRKGPINERIQQVVPDLFQSHVTCAGIENGIQGACRGDSGGPLQFYNPVKDRHYQVAIVHGSVAECGDPEWPTVYVKLDDPAILSFIQNATLIREESAESHLHPAKSIDDAPNIQPVSDLRTDDPNENLNKSDWLLIGSEGERFELYNWITGEQCFATVGSQGYSSYSTEMKTLNDVAIYCETRKGNCYKFLAGSQRWVKFSTLPVDVLLPVMTFVPGKGLVIFDAREGKVTTQILEDMDQKWKIGPKIIGLWGTDCAVQLNKTTTVFIDSKSVAFYDWSTNELTVRDEALQSSHLVGHCDAVKDEIGNDLVVVTRPYPSGSDPHLEIFNPTDGSVQLEKIPFEAKDDGVRHGGGGLLAVNGGKDLLMFGGQLLGSSQYLDSIKKFNYATKTWTEQGRMLIKRLHTHVVPIRGLQC